MSNYFRVKSLYVPTSFFLCTFLSLISFNRVYATEKLPEKMVISQAVGHLTHKLAASVIAEAYRRLDIESEFLEVPSKRSLALANLGHVDGEVGRVTQALTDFPNMLMVKSVPIAHVVGVATTLDSECVCNNWQDLKGLRIGIRRGEVYAEKGTKGMFVHATGSYNQLFSMLKNKRIDIAIGIISSVELELKTSFENSGIKVIGQPLVSVPLYHMIHKKHKALLPKLNRVLQEMKKNDDIERIQRATMENIIADRKRGEKF